MARATRKDGRPTRSRARRMPDRNKDGVRRARGPAASTAAATTARTPHLLVRLRPGVSLCQLSDRTGLSLSLLSRLFNGKRRLTVNVTRRVAQALDVSTDRVMDVLAPAQRLPPAA